MKHYVTIKIFSLLEINSVVPTRLIHFDEPFRIDDDTDVTSLTPLGHQSSYLSFFSKFDMTLQAARKLIPRAVSIL